LIVGSAFSAALVSNAVWFVGRLVVDVVLLVVSAVLATDGVRRLAARWRPGVRAAL
jgi:hypothetical protein